MIKNINTKSFTLSLLLAVGGYAVAVTATPVLLNHFINEYGLVSAQQGMMTSMISFGSILSSFLIMLLLGRVKKTFMIVISAIMQALMLALVGFSTSLAALLAACVLLGLGCGLVDTYANSCIVDVNRGNSAKYMGALHGVFGVGSLATPILIQFILLGTGWRGAYFTLAAIVGVTAVQFMMVADAAGKNISMEEMNEPKLTRSEVKAYFTSSHNLLLLLACVFLAAGQIGFLGWIVRYMTVVYGTEAMGATAITMFWIFGTISRFGAPQLPVDPMKLHIWGAILAGVILLAAIFSGSAVVMLIAAGFIGFLSAPCIPLLLNEGMARYRSRTTLPTNVIFFAMRITYVLMPLLQGMLSDPERIEMSMIIPAVVTVLSGITGYAAWHTGKKLCV